MALSKFELETLNRLAGQLRRDAAKLIRFGEYYEGTHHLEQLGLAIPPDLRQFVVCVNWPRITADSLEERIDLEGFRMPGKHERDADLWRIWQANNLDEESQLAHLDAIVYGRSYICIGSREDDPETPLITVESPLEMTAEISPKTREVTAALRLYRDKDEDGRVVDKATLYFPNVTIWAEKRWSGESRGWTEVSRDNHDLGRVPVVPLVNRARVGDHYGVSEPQDVIDLTDAAARALTLAQLATEALSVPQRAVLGAQEKDFVGPDGKVLPKWQAYFGAIWALENRKRSSSSSPPRQAAQQRFGKKS
ncbi:phage portal protein [Amycolatopsis sp. WAC 04182]|uniref:phage portal protein n=1 Tax=Amycolatopsis sp. WAC 04182 TaxID=2203198 RepID=UPI0013151A13|nr:phage portal protein [Amycolatopsis sp. WAC 04182]